MRSSVAWDDADRHLRLAELRGLDGQSDRASHRQLAAAAQGEAVDGRDDRLAEVFDDRGEALPLSRLGLGLGRGVVGHLGDVRAGCKRLVARAGQDHAAHAGIVSGLVEDLAELGDRGLVEGVEHLRPVERHVGDRSLFLVENVFAG